MPAKDIFHEAVKHALIKDGWNITADPYCIRLADSDINVFVGLAAERIIAAERANDKIAVEVKSFLGTSFITNFHQALGQFLDYRMTRNQTGHCIWPCRRTLLRPSSADVLCNWSALSII